MGKDINLSDAERNVVEDMVRERSVDLPKRPWMQPHRFRLVQKEARRRIGKLPPKGPKPPTDRTTYWAPRRVTGVPVGSYVIHESDGDVPICHYGKWFAAENVPREQLGPGQVSCTWCGYINA